MSGSPTNSKKSIRKVSKWLPANHHANHNWLEDLIKHVTKYPKPFHPVIREFQDLIEDDPILYLLVNRMFEQVPTKPPFNRDPTGAPQVRNYHLMLSLFNELLTRAPEYDGSEFVGFPYNAILNWPMGTKAGYTVFLNDKVNDQLRKMLTAWTTFLGSPDSCYVLSNDAASGWFGESAMASMPNFYATFQCDPSKPYHGFTSWDNFFTRQLKSGARPIAAPDDDDVVSNACEAAPFRLATNAKKRDGFWLKSQPYSLYDMLAGSEDEKLAPQFYSTPAKGATVYQAYLNARSYHRWHSPVNGKVVGLRMIPGTYYSACRSEGFDPAAPNNSQGYITQVATRALIYIQADSPNIGLMCFMAVGMGECSTCQITVAEGATVRKGDELGMFHYGGSTHCLIFRPGVEIRFDLKQTPSVNATDIPVNALIAIAGKEL